ncbi:MAG: hypothetical protein P8Z41_12985 [Anaerolineales bacterium]
MPPESILIAGTGALACYFAARLALHAEVTLLGTWPQGLARSNWLHAWTRTAWR